MLIPWCEIYERPVGEDEQAQPDKTQSDEINSEKRFFLLEVCVKMGPRSNDGANFQHHRAGTWHLLVNRCFFSTLPRTYEGFTAT